MVRKALASILLLAVGALSVNPTAAQAPRAADLPPDNAGIDQFSESVPSATGEVSPLLRAMDNARSPLLDPRQRAALERFGPDAKTLADIIDATAPRVRAPDEPSLSPPEGESPIAATIRAALTGGGGEGSAIAALLLVLLPAAGARTWRRVPPGSRRSSRATTGKPSKA